MRDFYVINKKEGETPLMRLESFRIKKKIERGVPMTYAGRLDPMASGLMIILVGEECKEKQKYLNLDKEYDFEILFGFETDTYDILGKIIPPPIRTNKPIDKMGDLEKNIKKNLKFFKGKFVQKYPMYSSKTVRGKQLHAYARSGEEIEAPEHEVYVKTLKFLKIKKISAEKLLENIEKRIGKVEGPASTRKGEPTRGGDFRQKEILKLWYKVLSDKKTLENFFVASFSATVSSGTYIRVLAHDLGERIGLPALAYKIKRTKVGKYDKLI